MDHLGRAFGNGSPIDRLAQRSGKVLVIGVGHASNSMIHVAEEHANIPKVSWYDPLPHVYVRTPEGEVISVRLDTSASCSAAFGAAEGVLRKHNEIRDLRLRDCRLQLMLGTAVIERVAELLREKSDHLLCTWPGCKPCAGARGALRAQGRIG